MQRDIIFKASLRVSGKLLNPEAVTIALAVTPASSAKTDDIIGNSKQNYQVKSSFWFGEIYKITYQENNIFTVPNIVSQVLIEKLRTVENIDEINLSFLINGDPGDIVEFIREYGEPIEILVKQEAQFINVDFDIPTLGFDEIVQLEKPISLQNLVNY